eukprot:TRINITY_DN19451_c0_g1_i1.p2 TRINITY_DN19451_c0_g1~~TRINITY_DN19451_c0_g1_i1.p2  ORF type:complete len:151 (+),score=53.47 TRINITY_DN19451_c0_g1_i1:564-1016(+)
MESDKAASVKAAQKAEEAAVQATREAKALLEAEAARTQRLKDRARFSERQELAKLAAEEEQRQRTLKAAAWKQAQQVRVSAAHERRPQRRPAALPRRHASSSPQPSVGRIDEGAYSRLLGRSQAELLSAMQTGADTARAGAAARPVRFRN